jgi:hypothetical protein
LHFFQQNTLLSIQAIEITTHKHTIPRAIKSRKKNNIGKVGSSFYSSRKAQLVRIMASFARYGF